MVNINEQRKIIGEKRLKLVRIQQEYGMTKAMLTAVDAETGEAQKRLNSKYKSKPINVAAAEILQRNSRIKTGLMSELLILRDKLDRGTDEMFELLENLGSLIRKDIEEFQNPNEDL